MNKKRWLALLLVGILVIAMVGCGGGAAPDADDASTPSADSEGESLSKEEADNVEKGNDDPLEIAVVVKIAGIPFFNALEDGVKKAAEEFDVNAYVIGPTDADPAQQVKLIEDLISAGVDALVVVPNDATALEAVLQRARDKGIFVIANESPGQKGADYDIEMIDNKKLAEAAAEVAAKAMGGSGEYVTYVGGLSVPLHNTWTDLANEYIAENYPEMTEVTDRIPCGEDAELAHTKTLELIKTYPNLKGIIGFGSLGPIGAAQAVREKNLIGELAVVGNVMPEQASQYLKDGSIVEGLLWNPADSGYAAVYTAKHLIEGGDIAAEDFSVPGIGAPEIVDGNVLIFDATLHITADNCDSLGF